MRIISSAFWLCLLMLFTFRAIGLSEELHQKESENQIGLSAGYVIPTEEWETSASLSGFYRYFRHGYKSLFGIEVVMIYIWESEHKESQDNSRWMIPVNCNLVLSPLRGSSWRISLIAGGGFVQVQTTSPDPIGNDVLREMIVDLVFGFQQIFPCQHTLLWCQGIQSPGRGLMESSVRLM